MKERPILFSGAMVRAILDVTKTQTRRVVKPEPWEVIPHRAGDPIWPHGFKFEKGSTTMGEPFVMPCPYGQPGDLLWAKETHKFNGTGGGPRVTYRADGAEQWFESAPDDSPAWIADDVKWRPSIFMPRWASRITLEVESVRVERLQDISEEDAKSEGPGLDDGAGRLHPTYKLAYANLWESINGPGSWGANPWVWVVTFKQQPPRP